MKKIFTCISLAAATFMATTPVMAQQQKQLTDKEKAAVVKVIVPAVFDQVKQISGFMYAFYGPAAWLVHIFESRVPS